MRASSQFNPEQLPSLPAGGRSLSNRCASYGVKLALGAGLHRTFRRAIESTRHLNSQIGKHVCQDRADLSLALWIAPELAEPTLTKPKPEDT